MASPARKARSRARPAAAAAASPALAAAAPRVRLDEARAPHLATRATVEREGEAAVAALYQAFDEFNAAHFEGKLLPPLLLVTHTSSPRALGDACERDPHGLRSIVRVQPKTLSRGLPFARDVLLHEMIHVWQYEVAGDSERGYRGHGPRFAEQCNAIGARLGLPPVGVKGRKGLPDCAQWPLCVRAPGYYGDEGAEKERAKRASRERPSQEDRDEQRAENAKLGAAAVCELCADEAEENGDPPTVARTLRNAAAYLRAAAAAADAGSD
jgi:hypothetical protein